jgi:hypothetical protein
MRLRRSITALALLSALTFTGAGLINSSPAPAHSVASIDDASCTDSSGHVVPIGTTAQGSDGHTYQCQYHGLFDIGMWVDLGPTDTLPSGGGPKHQPLQA